jgi:hypothetical protein
MVELLVFGITILIFASMIGISMVAFRIAIKSLVEVKVLADEVKLLKNGIKKVK